MTHLNLITRGIYLTDSRELTRTKQTSVPNHMGVSPLCSVPRRIRELIYPSDGYHTSAHTPQMRAEQVLVWARRQTEFQEERENKE